jgi:hypothetical protein
MQDNCTTICLLVAFCASLVFVVVMVRDHAKVQDHPKQKARGRSKSPDNSPQHHFINLYQGAVVKGPGHLWDRLCIIARTRNQKAQGLWKHGTSYTARAAMGCAEHRLKDFNKRHDLDRVLADAWSGCPACMCNASGNWTAEQVQAAAKRLALDQEHLCRKQFYMPGYKRVARDEHHPEHAVTQADECLFMSDQQAATHRGNMIAACTFANNKLPVYEPSLEEPGYCEVQGDAAVGRCATCGKYDHVCGHTRAENDNLTPGANQRVGANQSGHSYTRGNPVIDVG